MGSASDDKRAALIGITGKASGSLNDLESAFYAGMLDGSYSMAVTPAAVAANLPARLTDESLNATYAPKGYGPRVVFDGDSITLA